MNTTRRPIPLHYLAGIGTACMKLITPTARICHTEDLAQVTCRACLRAVKTPQETRTDELADDILLEVLNGASGTFCPCGASWTLDDAERVIARTPYLKGSHPATRTEREAEARKRVCPKCHAEACRPCKRRGPEYRPLGPNHPRYNKPMKGIHAERLALVTS